MGDVIEFPARAARTLEPNGPGAPTPHPDVELLWRELVGDSLRTERQAAGLRLVDVAERAGVSPQYLSEVERGLKDPSSEILAALSGALDLRIAELLVRAAGAFRTGGGHSPGPVCLAA
jgi:ribosome-binding protein aMBF1 (putative translation factor)